MCLEFQSYLLQDMMISDTTGSTSFFPKALENSWELLQLERLRHRSGVQSPGRRTPKPHAEVTNSTEKTLFSQAASQAGKNPCTLVHHFPIAEFHHRPMRENRFAACKFDPSTPTSKEMGKNAQYFSRNSWMIRA